MKRLHRLLPALCAIILSALVIALTPLNARAAEVIHSGTWGTCPWEIDADGVLTVHPGVGESQAGKDKSPWSDYSDSIASIVIAEENGEKAVAPANISRLFCNLGKTETIDATGLDVSSVTNMSYLFADTRDIYGYRSLERVDLTGWDTSHVTTMNHMFSGDQGLRIVAGLSELDVSSVTDMGSMFDYCYSLRFPDLSSWDVSSVTDMSAMFNECHALTAIDLTTWDVSSVTNMSNMFYFCSSLTSIDLSTWDTSSVTNMSNMFVCPRLTFIDLSGWNTSNVTTMHAMFSNCVELEHLDVPSWGWDTSSVTSMSEMFRECTSLVSLDLSSWNTPSLITAEDMFRECESLVTLDLSGWTTTPTTRMARMFSGCSALKVIYAGSGWTTYYALEQYGQTFYGCTSLVGGNGTAYEDKYQTATYARIDTPDNPGMLTDASARPEKSSIEGAQIAPIPGQTYSGSAIKPEVAVTLGGKTLVRGVDYTVAYADNANVGTATVIVYGVGAYTGHVSTTFEIDRQSIASASTSYSGVGSTTYDGTEHIFGVSVSLDGRQLVEDADYTLVFSDNVNAGTAKITITGIGNYNGSLVETFDISAASIDDAVMTLDATRYVYDGTEKRPAMSVVLDGRELVAGTDYRIEYSYNVDASEYPAFAFAYGMGNYKDFVRGEFYIDPCPITEATVAPIPSQRYTGSAITPDVVVTYNGMTLAKGTDYTVEYSDNTDVGTATVTITGKDNYSGTATASFEIARELVSIEGADFTIFDQTVYTGSALEPEMMVTLNGFTLEKDVDFTVSYANNVNAGMATITITGIGNYTGTASEEFEILPQFISWADVAPIPSQTWTGSAITPEVTLTFNGTQLVEGTDYKVTGYDDNVDVGVATIHIEGVGNFDNETTVEFEIVPPIAIDISDALVTLEYASVGYDGTGHLPAVKVTCGGAMLTEDYDYLVEYKDNVEVGMAKVIITGIGAYTGVTEATFEIVPAEEPPSAPFFLDADPADDANHGAEVDWMGRSGISAGWEVAGGREFRGMLNVTRCDFAAFLYRMADLADDGVRDDSIKLTDAEVEAVLDGVRDCTPSTDHAPEVAWLIDSGISRGWGNPDGTVSFRPYANVARQDMAAFLYRFADLDDDGVQNRSPEMGDQRVVFSDVAHGDEANHAAEVEWLASVGVTRGWDMGDGTFRFRGTYNVARQDMAAFMYRLYTYLQSQG